MAKNTTKDIQQQLITIGETLGFRAQEEFTFERQQGYTPRYDVVWLLDVQKLNVAHLPGVMLLDERWLPFAAFEIEGSTTSSKNQVGNVGNLLMAPTQYRFIVVANEQATTERDTYRRGVKIVRTMQELFGNYELFFLDASMLHTLEHLEETTIVLAPERAARLKGSGGEKQSLQIAKRLYPLLAKTKLALHQDYTSDYYKIHYEQKTKRPKEYTYEPSPLERRPLRGVTSYYYCSKIDWSAGFEIEGGFVQFLRQLAENLGPDVTLYPRLAHLLKYPNVTSIYYPLLGIEFETGQNKHAIGGLMNAGRLHQFGWIVADESFRNAVETYQTHFGLQNTYFLPTQRLKGERER
ncbi:hypothetical protein [Savagea faecisuis]|uniref:Uncharacterized protein n=1 Tax=Savagea faecisuis TaxID=1274803 RepID=A0ABW3GXP1_9BACL